MAMPAEICQLPSPRVSNLLWQTAMEKEYTSRTPKIHAFVFFWLWRSAFPCFTSNKIYYVCGRQRQLIAASAVSLCMYVPYLYNNGKHAVLLQNIRPRYRGWWKSCDGYAWIILLRWSFPLAPFTSILFYKQRFEGHCYQVKSKKQDDDAVAKIK